VLDGLGVDVPAAVVAGGAGPEDGGAVVSEVTVADVKARIRLRSDVALLLGGRRSEDAASVLAVVDAWETCQ
jgi:hypothetical protein